MACHAFFASAGKILMENCMVSHLWFGMDGPAILVASFETSHVNGYKSAAMCEGRRNRQ